MKEQIPRFLLTPSSSDFNGLEGKSLKAPFLEKGIHRLAEMITTAYSQWEFASRQGFFQKLDSRIKVLFLVCFIIIVSLKKDIGSEILIGAFILLLALLSRLDLPRFYKRILLLGSIFGFLMALPSVLNLFREGELILTILRFPGPYRFWIYDIPDRIGITREGLHGMVMLTLRVVNSLSITFLVLYTTSFAEIVKALKIFRLPDPFLIILSLAYKYLFLFGRTVEEIHLAKKSRLLKELSRREARQWIAGRMAFMFKKTRLRAEEVFKAMLCRGFSDSIKIPETSKLKKRDWAVGTALLLAGGLLLWI